MTKTAKPDFPKKQTAPKVENTRWREFAKTDAGPIPQPAPEFWKNSLTYRSRSEEKVK